MYTHTHRHTDTHTLVHMHAVVMVAHAVNMPIPEKPLKCVHILPITD